jgi:hypothetical protein
MTYSAETGHFCAHCGADAGLCIEKKLLGEALRRCCAACNLGRRWHDITRRITAKDVPGQRLAAPSGRRISENQREATVEQLLALAGRDRSDIETFDAPSIAAYRSLARSRGVPLEQVIRVAVKDELRSVVDLPPTWADG